MIHEKFQSLDTFKSFKAKVELQLGKKIKDVKSECGGEYYDTYDGSGEQRLGPFALFLKECELFNNTLCQVNLAWMVKQNDETELLSIWWKVWLVILLCKSRFGKKP